MGGLEGPADPGPTDSYATPAMSSGIAPPTPGSSPVPVGHAPAPTSSPTPFAPPPDTELAWQAPNVNAPEMPDTPAIYVESDGQLVPPETVSKSDERKRKKLEKKVAKRENKRSKDNKDQLLSTMNNKSSGASRTSLWILAGVLAVVIVVVIVLFVTGFI